MTKVALAHWFSVARGQFFHAFRPAALVLGVSPFFLYIVSSAANAGIDRHVRLDTGLVSDPRIIALEMLFLIVILAMASALAPHRDTISQKLAVTFGSGGGGLFIPLTLAALSFYAPVLVLAWSNNLGSSTTEGFLVATPLVQASFNVYLVVLSVTALIRYFFVTAVVQTHVSGFILNLTADLERLVKRKKGQLRISLPWLAYGKLSLDPELFQGFCSALERCFQEEGIIVTIHTVSEETIRKWGETAIQSELNEIDEVAFADFLACELAVRQMAEAGGVLNIIDEMELLACVMVDELLYAVHIMRQKAQQEGHLGKAFISMQITDPHVCTEYKLALSSRHSQVAAATADA